MASLGPSVRKVRGRSTRTFAQLLNLHHGIQGPATLSPNFPRLHSICLSRCHPTMLADMADHLPEGIAVFGWNSRS